MEQSELQVIADLTAEELGLRIRPKVEVNDVRSGRARTITGKVTVPLWATEGTDEYAIYYTVHEVCHFSRFRGHSPAFKKLEQDILTQWDIKIDYARAYPKALYNLNGQRLCGKLGRK